MRSHGSKGVHRPYLLSAMVMLCVCLGEAGAGEVDTGDLKQQVKQVPVYGNEVDFDIVSAVRRAVDTHPVIAESIGRLFQQNEQVAVARAGYYPELSAGLSRGYRDSTGRSEEALTASASQMLYDFGKVSSSVAAASHGVERDRANVLLAVDQLAQETAQAVIEVQRYQTLLTIAREQVEAIGELQELASQRAAKGAATRSDEIQALSRKEAAQATVLQFQAQSDAWQRNLQSLLNAPGPVTVSPEFPDHLADACLRVEEDFDNVPRIMRAEAEREEARSLIRQARAQMLPTFSISADFEHYLNDRPADLEAMDRDNDVFVSVGVSSKLFQGGALKARRRAADYALEAANAARDAAYREVSLGLREAKVQTRSLYGRLELLNNRYNSIAETQKLYRQQYLALGTRSLLDILNTEQEIHQSRFEQQNTRFDLRRLQIDCLYNVAEIRAAFGLSSAAVQGVPIQP